MSQKPRHIKTIDQLHREMPRMIKRINADEDLARRAAANPLLAIEELGYSLEESVRAQAARRIRFGGQTAEQLEQLQAEIFRHVGHPFDLDSGQELARVLFEELKLPQPDAAEQRDHPPAGYGDEQSQTSARPSKRGQKPQAKAAGREPPSASLPTEPLPPAIFGRPAAPDPLEQLRERHPVMEPLLAYRRLDASEPRLAPRELYERIKTGDVALPNLRLRVRLRSTTEPE